MRKLFLSESGLTLVQVGASALVSIGIGYVVERSFPLFAPLVAVTLVQVLCAPHRRGLWLFLFGEVNGALVTTMFIPHFSTRHAALSALIGAFVAIAVAYLSTPRNPVRRVNEAIEPVLSLLSINTRAIAAALRSGDTAAAGTAVFALNDVDHELNRLQDVLRQVRRSAIWSRVSRRNLAENVNSAREIGFAVRDIRTLARHAWWGVLRTGEPVPPALPQMLEALADGLAVLRDEMHRDGQPHEARPLLISAGRWVDVMRSQPLSISAATVAASADAAVLDLLIATGVPLNDADQMLRRPSYS
ncbi:hypothetical protein Rhe02_23250 [Rhizocola hellebori]|uniref:FUSC family protein n=1 Tax=Rhizocola hellebori TaxID=1392758 RepID=A0A8J3VFW1_9ACTN|nr:hypothetical protein [Rhizocola hellebori]GIH04258.1 hypothetical protein Rhe02_23250 [Rhizocola hellebori]